MILTGMGLDMGTVVGIFVDWIGCPNIFCWFCLWVTYWNTVRKKLGMYSIFIIIVRYDEFWKPTDLENFIYKINIL